MWVRCKWRSRGVALTPSRFRGEEDSETLCSPVFERILRYVIILNPTVATPTWLHLFWLITTKTTKP